MFDPKNWKEDTDRLAALAADYARSYLRRAGDLPAFPDREALAALDVFKEPLPEKGTDPEAVLSLLTEKGEKGVCPTAGGRYYGFVLGGMLPIATAASFVTDAWNQNAALYSMSPTAATLEEVAEDWVADLFGFPKGTAMGLVTGSANALLTSFIAARNTLLARQGWDLHRQGMTKSPGIRVVLSAEAHSAVLGALYYLGIGTEELEFVPVDEHGRMIPEAVPPLDERTLFILQAGHICGGSYDPSDELGDIGNEAGAWVHVDGAFGLWARVTPGWEHVLKGLEKADSCNMDIHKTLNGGYDSSILLYKDREALLAALAVGGSYLATGAGRDGSGYATEMSRRARGIVLWAILKQLGREGVSALMKHLTDMTCYFAEGMEKAGYELIQPPCFNQFACRAGTEEETMRALAYVQNSGITWSGSSDWKGETVMRFSVCSCATTEEDIDAALAVYRAALEER